MEDLESTTAVPKGRKAGDELGEEMWAQLDGSLTEAEAQPRPRGWRVLREVAETILLTVLIFAVINTVTGRFRVEGPSMSPNLGEGQYLIINRKLAMLPCLQQFASRLLKLVTDHRHRQSKLPGNIFCRGNIFQVVTRLQFRNTL